LVSALAGSAAANAIASVRRMRRCFINGGFLIRSKEGSIR
jgi:hypothetical protein